MGNGAAITSLDHALQLGPYESKPSDLPLDLMQVMSRDLFGSVTRKRGSFGQCQKLADILNAKAQVAGVADEVKSTHRTLVISTLPAFGTARRGNEIVLFIKPYGWDFDPSERREPTDADTSHVTKFLLNLQWLETLGFKRGERFDPDQKQAAMPT